MPESCYVGIDTSNYTTSVALCDARGEIMANLKLPLSVKEGDRGLRQSDAVFAHVKNLPVLMRELGVLLKDYEVRGIGVSARPRDAEGSYMPCFLARSRQRRLPQGLEYPFTVFRTKADT